MNTAKTTKVRQYLHGDPAEGNPERFYCQRCDLFVPVDWGEGQVRE